MVVVVSSAIIGDAIEYNEANRADRYTGLSSSHTRSQDNTGDGLLVQQREALDEQQVHPFEWFSEGVPNSYAKSIPNSEAVSAAGNGNKPEPTGTAGVQPAGGGGPTGPSVSQGQGSDCCYFSTRYGESYNGSPMGCTGKPYGGADVSILAVPPALSRVIPCGTRLRICNESQPMPTGTASVASSGVLILRRDSDGLYAVRCIDVTRQDSCPGCLPNHLDLSEAGNAVLCGVNYPETCDRVVGLSIEFLE